MMHHSLCGPDDFEKPRRVNRVEVFLEQMDQACKVFKKRNNILRPLGAGDGVPPPRA